MPIRPASVLDQAMIIECNNMFDDASSVGSTEECVASYRHPKKARALGKKCRRVSFNESANVSYSNSQIAKEDTKDLWYSSSEYPVFKRNHTEEARLVIRAELDQKKTVGSYLDVMNRVFDACCGARDLDATEVNELERISSCSRVGLERLTVRCIRMDKKTRRQELVDTLLEIQEENGQLTIGEKEQLLAQAMQEISRPSRLFAMYLAAAQQKAQ